MRRLIALLCLMPVAAIAAEAAPAAGGVTDAVTKEGVIAFLIGVVGVGIVKWLAGWINGKGVELVQAELKKLQEKLNENSVLSQIQADDALIEIAEHAIPEVLAEITDTLKNDLKDGKLDKVDWADLGKRLWAKIEPQVRGGVNDYLKTSSFQDGQTLAAMVLKRFFAHQKASAEGVITEAARVTPK